jgi:hypothetical protein
MGFPIDLPSGKGMTINYLLCIIALSCFFWRISGTVVAVGVPDFFFACGWIGLLVFLRNEKKQCAKLCEDCKKCDKKKTTAGLIVRR